MGTGIKLTSPDELENAASKMNILYVIAAIISLLLLISGAGFFIIIVLFIIAWILKGEYLKWKIRGFREMEFWKPDALTMEQIKERASDILGKRDIQVVLEKDELSFVSGSIIYEYINVANGVFRLRWGYTLAKALFSYSYVTNYNKVRADMGYIVYTIQNLATENIVD